MSQRKKTREEILSQPFLNTTDIAKLLAVSRPKAERIYSAANQIDSELKYRIEPTKVRMTSMLKVTGLNFNILTKQIKSAAATAPK